MIGYSDLNFLLEMLNNIKFVRVCANRIVQSMMDLKSSIVLLTDYSIGWYISVNDFRAEKRFVYQL